ncbi:hypothetical protein SAMN05216388_103413 [Halorientalis persicus]|uniref:Uncharacterized protein n=1 Tax=Halorientalis persicus TaxID=1367881 RepID=A0A1H8V795_9EURY|nr:hypothetical protein SAMN05216388_103413 [Halorientalis persicus]
MAKSYQGVLTVSNQSMLASEKASTNFSKNIEGWESRSEPYETPIENMNKTRLELWMIKT